MNKIIGFHDAQVRRLAALRQGNDEQRRKALSQSFMVNRIKIAYEYDRNRFFIEQTVTGLHEVLENDEAVDKTDQPNPKDSCNTLISAYEDEEICGDKRSLRIARALRRGYDVVPIKERALIPGWIEAHLQEYTIDRPVGCIAWGALCLFFGEI